MSEVRAIDTGAEWILRVQGREEPRCVARRESEEQEPETVCWGSGSWSVWQVGAY